MKTTGSFLGKKKKRKEKKEKDRKWIVLTEGTLDDLKLDQENFINS
jgi:hypothetical protein